MRVVDRAAFTDAGRKRRRNEDEFVVSPPLFVVADGMGGARAGEIASRLAAAAFREYHDADDLSPERRLTAIVQEANRRIYERARSDAQASGMGTTVTAALVGRDFVAIGHVGDSRAYRIRGDELEQLTHDHSLVADLVRSGRLTAEEAESHPQRSVITRALGTDPEVDVDTFTVDAAPGDVFLLCSDGLTTMLDDEAILAAIRDDGDLESKAKALVKAANRRGGEDNVTVVLFAVDREDAVEESGRAASDGRGEREDLEDTLTGLDPPPGARPGDTFLGKAEGATWEPLPRAGEKRRARNRRALVLSLVTLVLAASLVVLALWALAQAHFVGVEPDGRVAIYQGVPWEIGFGISLYRTRYVSLLRAVQLSGSERRALFDHDLVSYREARRRIARFEHEGVP